MNSHAAPIERIESLIRVDPAQRGLMANGDAAAIGVGQLAAAARHLAEEARQVGIVTGFAVPTSSGPVAETDGPIGAVVLGSALTRIGVSVRFITDSVCASALRAAAEFAGLSPDLVLSCPLEWSAADQWCDRFFDQQGDLTHLVAIERVGPSHTVSSLELQQREGPAPVEEFQRIVPATDRGHCFNMRGERLDGLTAPLHRLFEELDRRLPRAKSIGVCDGGNEIGMGTFPWEVLHPLVADGQGPRIACRVATDWTILAGTSNWGAYGLAAAVAILTGRPDALQECTLKQQEDLLRHLVTRGPAVDGVTRLQEPTVDGLPFITYIQPWTAIREVLGLDKDNGERGT